MEITKLDSAENWYRCSYKNVVNYGTTVANAIENCFNHYEFLKELDYDGGDELFEQKRDLERSPVEFVNEY